MNHSKIIVYHPINQTFESKNAVPFVPFNEVSSYSRPSIQLAHRSPTRLVSNGDPSNYATLRKPPISPKTSLNKPQQSKFAANTNPMATSSFRLPPPLSSTTNTNSTISPNTESFSSSRTRSLENLNSNEKLPIPVESHSSLTNGNSLHSSNKPTNLQLLGDANLSSSTESTNGLPFANENVGTIKQRSPHNHQNSHLYNSSINAMKRSLPIQFFEQSNTHLLKPTYPLTSTAIYDNNERYLPTNLVSPSKQPLRKPTTLSPPHVNGRNPSTFNAEKRLQYNKIVKYDCHHLFCFLTSTYLLFCPRNDTTNVLSDIDSMLSDLNRELDQMLDYEPTTS